MRFLLCFLVASASAVAQWQPQNSGTDVSLRGISAVSSKVAWASGAKGTVLRTVDGGDHWEKLAMEGAQQLDFRNVRAFSATTAYVMSIGPGEQSRIYKTTDAGQHWQSQFTNHHAKAFYDCFAFWDEKHGIALSDSVDGAFPLISTSDGENWSQLHPSQMPAALPNEGAFAASGTCIAIAGQNDVWFATGGPAARVFHSADRGQTWTVVTSPILSGAASQGIFSIVFHDPKNGVMAGGDYERPTNRLQNCAYTHDGGAHWTLAKIQPGGYRSAVAFISDAFSSKSTEFLIATGTTGSDYSTDGGNTWLPADPAEYNAMSFAGPRAGWAVGSKGRIAKFKGLPKN
ncbi:MAG TPA: YCF48-related protein [Candidatus Angelobacter sp.]|nr:YCF48-related protein [Candidatus Angelobacter sp.]